MHDIRSLSLPEITEIIKNLRQPIYRAAQIFTWIHKRHVNDFEAMTDLPKPLRAALKEIGCFSPFTLAEVHPSNADKTCKYLFAMDNNTIIESVFMEHRHGNSVCVSTQAGCRMGCAFCASAIGGLERNLTAGEMTSQLYAIAQETNKRIDSVVLMGCGEPLDNFVNCLRFLSLINHPNGLHIGLRHVTLSTCGLVPEIIQLAEHALPITLAVSLHAAEDGLRRQLMPIAKRYTIRETMQVCTFYAETTRRRITFEYALIDTLNDSDKHALDLAALLKEQLCHVNLLPVNANAENFMPSRRTQTFLKILLKQGIPVTLRRSLGSDVQAACGQLRKRHLNR